MPFLSTAQARFLFAREPKVAKEFAKKTKSIKRLPEKITASKPAVTRRKATAAARKKRRS